MIVSTAFAAKTTLVAALRAAEGLADLAAEGSIWFGYQGAAGQRPRECVWVGEIQWDDEEGTALGALRRDETYRIVLAVESHMPGDNQEAANERVHARLAVVEETLRDPRVLGVPGIYEVGIVPQMLGEGSDSTGRGAMFLTAVRIRARK